MSRSVSCRRFGLPNDNSKKRIHTSRPVPCRQVNQFRVDKSTSFVSTNQPVSCRQVDQFRVDKSASFASTSLPVSCRQVDQFRVNKSTSFASTIRPVPCRQQEEGPNGTQQSQNPPLFVFVHIRAKGNYRSRGKKFPSA
jgi:hypothetical protein